MAIVPSSTGTNGCNGLDQSFLSCEEINLALPLVSLMNPQASTLKRITSTQSSSDLLYATVNLTTSSGTSIIEMDLSDPVSPPALRHLLPEGAIDDLVSSLLGVAGSKANLAGLTVLDDDTVLVLELTSNTVLAVGRNAPGFLFHFAGRASATPEFIDGAARTAAGFAFDEESELCATEDGLVFVTDTGNHALRVISAASVIDPAGIVLTVTGMGPSLPGFADGDLVTAMFDSPTGIATHCADRLIVTERGDNGAGHRLRSIQFDGFDLSLGIFTGTVLTEVGDGMPLTSAGLAPLAQTAAPNSPAVSASGEIYWIDSLTGVMRRESVMGVVDCPLAPSGDCSVPSMLCSVGSGADFAPGNSFSSAISGDGDLYVLESDTVVLRRFGP
ncbi:MAG: hypothetical protein ACI8TQ_003339 [Planctomycetota bacterium]|jgi:hypothetical protein